MHGIRKTSSSRRVWSQDPKFRKEALPSVMIKNVPFKCLILLKMFTRNLTSSTRIQGSSFYSGRIDEEACRSKPSMGRCVFANILSFNFALQYWLKFGVMSQLFGPSMIMSDLSSECVFEQGFGKPSKPDKTKKSDSPPSSKNIAGGIIRETFRKIGATASKRSAAMNQESDEGVCAYVRGRATS